MTAPLFTFKSQCQRKVRVPSMTSDQEAVCGTCAGDPRDGDGYHAYDCPERTGRIPVPVVPSDDECESRYRGQSCHLGRAHGGPHMNLDMGGHEWEDNTIGASAPPTPSQDAEGDGLADARQAVMDAAPIWEDARMADALIKSARCFTYPHTPQQCERRNSGCECVCHQKPGGRS